MNSLLWVAQVALALVFLAHGLAYLYPPAAVRKAMSRMPFSTGFFRFVGAAEILAALGLILPGSTGILPWLTPLAAAGLAPIMAGAAAFHLRDREWPQAIVTGAILALTILVAAMRWFVIPL